MLKDPTYAELVGKFERLLAKDGDRDYIILEGNLNYYGFPLPGFGLLLLGKADPIEKIFLNELLLLLICWLKTVSLIWML